MSSNKPGKSVATIRRVSYSDDGKATVHPAKKVAIVHIAGESSGARRRRKVA